MAEMVKDDFIMYNSFVVNMFHLTEKDVEMTREDFCKAVVKICSNTWVFPSEFNSSPTGWTEKLETLHEDHKDLIDGAINHTKNKTVKFSTKKVTFLPNSIFISVFSKFRNCSWSGELKT